MLADRGGTSESFAIDSMRQTAAVVIVHSLMLAVPVLINTLENGIARPCFAILASLQYVQEWKWFHFW